MENDVAKEVVTVEDDLIKDEAISDNNIIQSVEEKQEVAYEKDNFVDSKNNSSADDSTDDVNMNTKDENNESFDVTSTKLSETPSDTKSDNSVEENMIKPKVYEDNGECDVLEDTTISDEGANEGDLISSDPTSPSSFKARENIFDRVKNKSISESSANENLVEEPSEPVEQVKDYVTSQPETTPVKTPMVVSVGTIEVSGAQEYEDINIMSKGSTAIAEKEPIPDKSEQSSKNDDYESFRDLRFSSVSMYDKPHFEEDIEITVEDAQKHAAESFVSYKVITKTTRESFQQHEFHVRRRYQDFLWLSNVLIQQYPSHFIPPIPQKKVFNRYDPDFLRLRQLALNKFLKRIAEHPILSTSEHFFTFLSAKQVELTEQKKSTATKKFPNIQIPAKVNDSPFKSTSEYLDQFNKILAQMSSHSVKLHKDQTEQIQIMKTLSPSAALWANVEV